MADRAQTEAGATAAARVAGAGALGLRAGRRRKFAGLIWREMRHHPGSALAVAALAALIILATGVPLFWTKSPNAINLVGSLAGPSGAHPMGTDSFGRDLFVRFCAGARISLAVGALVVAVGGIVGSAIGIAAGMYRTFVDNVLMRVMDALLAFPPLILAMAVTVGLGVGLRTATLGIAITTVPYYARLVRSDVLRLRALPYVEAATALGASRYRIIRRHIIPHLLPTMLVQASSVFGYAILSLAALGFVGLGAQVPTPEWGATITDGLQYALTGQWWIGVFPGLGLLTAVVATSVLSDRLRDALDPRGEFGRI